MKITIEAEGKETLVYETDNAIVISSDGEKGTSTNILITKANPKQLFGITEALKSSMFRIIKDAPFVFPALLSSPSCCDAEKPKEDVCKA